MKTVGYAYNTAQKHGSDSRASLCIYTAHPKDKHGFAYFLWCFAVCRERFGEFSKCCIKGTQRVSDSLLCTGKQ